MRAAIAVSARGGVLAGVALGLLSRSRPPAAGMLDPLALPSAISVRSANDNGGAETDTVVIPPATAGGNGDRLTSGPTAEADPPGAGSAVPGSRSV